MIKGAQNPLTEYLDALALGRIVANRFRKWKKNPLIKTQTIAILMFSLGICQNCCHVEQGKFEI
jgi:hypothetical protein